MTDCVSLEVAQKLQKAGYENKTEKLWHCGDLTQGAWALVDWSNSDAFWELNNPNDILPAPTATQLAEELPAYIEIYQRGGFLGFWKRSMKSPNIMYGCNYENGNEKALCFVNADTLPDALGLMMVYLLENKLIK